MNISIIIPMYNAKNTVIETLKGLEAQSSKNFEVIVVDDGSSDGCPELIQTLGSQSSLPIKLVRQEHSGPAKARNLGVDNSGAKLIIFLDSDCVPPPNWIEGMTKPLGSENVAGCNCGYKARNGKSLIARYIDFEIAKRHEKLVGEDIDTIGSYSASFVKEVFVQAGGFDTKYAAASAEDFDLAFRITKLGYKLRFTGETFVWHFHPASLRKYLKQQFARGFWRVRMYLQHKDRIKRGDSYTGHEAQIQFVLSNLAFLSVPLSVVAPYSVLIGLGILLFSNMSIGIWIFPREKKLALIAPILASLRSLAGTAGVYAYLLRNFPRCLQEAK